MVTVEVATKALVLKLNSRERALLGRPSLSIELNRITGVSLETLPDKANLGIRISRRPLLGSLVGEWRSGRSRILVLRGRAGAQAVRISLKHPTIDQIWYAGADAKQLASQLAAK